MALESEKVELDLISVNPFEEFESSLMIFAPIANKKEFSYEPLADYKKQPVI